MNISVVGMGYVGLTLGVCLASKDHIVCFVDKNKEKVNKINEGEIVISEPNLENLFENAKKNISATFLFDTAFRHGQEINYSLYFFGNSQILKVFFSAENICIF